LAGQAANATGMMHQTQPHQPTPKPQTPTGHRDTDTEDPNLLTPLLGYDLVLLDANHQKRALGWFSRRKP